MQQQTVHACERNSPDLNSSNCYEREQCQFLKQRHDIQLRCFRLMRQNAVTSYELQVVINLDCIHTHIGDRAEL